MPSTPGCATVLPLPLPFSEVGSCPSKVLQQCPSTIQGAQRTLRARSIQSTTIRSKLMATAKKSAKPAAAPKAAPSVKPVKDVLNKTTLTALVAEQSGVEAKSVKAVLAALETVILGSVNKKGAGAFTLPGLLKIDVQKVPAKPKRKGINPFTKEEQVFAAKPATVRIKARALKKLKDAAL